jgi:hypothetical protein
VLIWVAARQQQCCGEDFAVGSSVRWQVLPAAADWIARLLGEGWGDTVRHAEDHHGDDDVVGEVSGVVQSVRVVTCERVEELPGGRGRAWVPVPGSGRLREVDVADP